MPSRRLPNSDLQRKVALTNAKNMNDSLPLGTVVLNPGTTDRLDAIQPDFAAKVTLRETAKYNQTIATSDLEVKRNAARTIIAQFFQTFNNGVQAGLFPPQARAFYGLDVSSPATPKLSSDDDIQVWGDNIKSGDPARVAAGGTIMATPSFIQVTAAFDVYVTAKYAQRNLKELYDQSQEVVDALRPEVDILIMNIWDEVEAYYNKGDINSKRRHAREWGVVYVNMPDAFSMEGQVTDVSGIPLPDAIVKIVEPDVSDDTDSFGNYKIEEVVPGTYTVEVTKEGYQTQIIPGIVITAGVVKQLNIQMISLTGNITVNVFAEGQPLEDATVGIEDLGLTAQTNAGGQAFLNNVSPGTWYVDASKEGYIPQNQQISIVAGETIVLSFELDLA